MSAHVMGDGRIIKREILTAAAQTWTSPTLDGNNDGGYILRGQIRNTTVSSSDIALLINGTGAGLAKVRLYGTGAAAASDANHSACAAGLNLDFWLTMPAAETGADRAIFGTVLVHTSSGISYIAQVAYKLDDTSGNITQMQISGSVPASLGIGTKVILERTF